MKNLIIIVQLILLLVIVSLYGFGQTVIQPTGTTQTIQQFTPAIIKATPSQSSALQAAYFTPLLTNAGVQTPTGGVPSVVTIYFFNDGASVMTVQFCGAANLPAPPPGL
jgi:hypothetical protein